VGLFPLAAPLIIHATLRRQSLGRAAFEQSVLLATVAGIGWLVLLTPGASAYIDKYLHEQVLDSLAGRREIVNSALGRFDIIWKMAKELALPAAIAIACVWSARRRNVIRDEWQGLNQREAPVEVPSSDGGSRAVVNGAIACCLVIGA